MITLATYGLGMLIGFTVAGSITDIYLNDGLHDWLSIWIFPAIFAGIVAVVFLVAFKKQHEEIDLTEGM